MKKGVRTTVVFRPHPDLRKLARALLLLVEEQRGARPEELDAKREAPS